MKYRPPGIFGRFFFLTTGEIVLVLAYPKASVEGCSSKRSVSPSVATRSTFIRAGRHY